MTRKSSGPRHKTDSAKRHGWNPDKCLRCHLSSKEDCESRMVDGISSGLDGFARWPEEDSQVPRVAQGVKDRVNKLKGLGNAIVPAVAYELMRMIMDIEQSERTT